jgi:hypothetical protein
MMKLFSILMSLTMILAPMPVLAQYAPEKIQKDGLQIGRSASLLPKELIFDAGEGASNKKLSLDPSDNEFDLNSTLNITGDLDASGNVSGGTISTAGTLSVDSTSTHKSGLTLGSGTDASKSITVDRAGFDPYLKWDDSSDKWVFSNDGSIEKKLGSGSGNGGGGINLLTNGSFEDGVAVNWSNIGGTVTGQTYTNAYEGNNAYAQFESTVIGDYIETALVTVPDNFGAGCQTTFKVKITSGSWSFKVIDGSSNDLISETAFTDPGPTTGEWIDIPVKSLRCPEQGDEFKLRITSTATGIINIDDAYLGSNKNTVSVASSGYMGKIEFSDSDCLFNNTSGTFADMTDATCTKTVSGRVAVRTDTPTAYGFSGVFPKGMCTVTFNGTMYGTEASTSGDANIYSRIYDATNAVAGPNNIHGGFSGGSFSKGDYTGSQTYKFASTGSLQNISIQTAINISTDSANITGSTLYVSCESDVTAEAVTAQSAEWFIDVSIGASASNPNLGVASVASYTEITDSGMDMVINSGSANAKIPCSSTNPSTGLTCSAGSEGLGVVFDAPAAGYYEVCSQFIANTENDATTDAVATTFQLVETSNSSQTILQEGKAKSEHRQYQIAGNLFWPHRNCGTFYFATAGTKTIRLMYEQLVSGTPTASAVLVDRSSVQGQRDAHFTVRPLLTANSRPYWTGNQVESMTPDTRMESCELNTTSAIFTVTGDNVARCGKLFNSVSLTSTGNVDLAQNNNTFSNWDYVTCVCSASGQADWTCGVAENYSSTTTKAALFDVSGNAWINGTLRMICIGVK